jgi:hypothetical protein
LAADLSWCSNVCHRILIHPKQQKGLLSMEVLKTDDRKTSVNEKIVQLRKALFSDDGKDKDVTNGIAMSFLKFDRSDRNFDIQFTPRLNDVEMKFAFDLIKCTMEEVMI